MWSRPATSLTVPRTWHWQGDWPEVFELDGRLGQFGPVGPAELGRLMLGSILVLLIVLLHLLGPLRFLR